jgi:hypothetical protein
VVFDYDLANSTTYKVTCEATCSGGLTSSLVTSTFATSFYVPPIPSIEATYNDAGGYASLAITNPVPTGIEVAASYNKVYRSVDGGTTYVLIADNISPNTTIIDYLPLLQGTTKYYAVAISTIPSSVLGYIEDLVLALTGVFFINSGSAYDDYIKILGDIKYSETRNRPEVLKRFEGRSYPVKYQGTEKNQSLEFSCDLPYADFDTLVSILEDTNDIFYRDWRGRWFNCSLLNPKFDQKDNSAYQFSCTITRIEI